MSGKFALLIGVGVAVSGCVGDDRQGIEGLSPALGNAAAANIAMQMVDPWQYGVQNTALSVPAQRGPVAPATADADASTTTTSSGVKN